MYISISIATLQCILKFTKTEAKTTTTKKHYGLLFYLLHGYSPIFASAGGEVQTTTTAAAAAVSVRPAHGPEAAGEAVEEAYSSAATDPGPRLQGELGRLQAGGSEADGSP